jgi:hypothetical protein
MNRNKSIPINLYVVVNRSTGYVYGAPVNTRQKARARKGSLEINKGLKNLKIVQYAAQKFVR